MDGWLLEQAVQLEAELTRARGTIDSLNSFAVEQAAELRRAWQRVQQLRERLRLQENILQGKKVAVIGPSFKESCYRDVVQLLGGRFVFAPSDEKYSLIDRAVAKGDIVVFLTGYASHVASDRARRAGERCGKSIVWLSGTGCDQLEAAIKEADSPKHGKRFGVGA